MDQDDSGIVRSASHCCAYTPSATARATFLYPLVAGRIVCEPGGRLRRDGTGGFVVVYVEDGSVTVSQSDRAYRASLGQFVLVDGSDAYECTADGPSQLLMLRYDGLGAVPLHRYITLEGERVIELPNRYFAVECMLVIYDALRRGEPVNEPRASLAITMLLTELADRAKAHGELLRWAGSVAKDRETMDRVIAYINGHLDEPLGLGELSAVAYVGRTKLLRLFKTETGMTPHAYVLRMRIAAARELLTQGDVPVGEIARRCGFADSATFAEAFRRVVGMPPTAYRKGGR